MSAIKFTFFIILISSTFCLPRSLRTFSIMLDPAGDAKHTGRVIQDSFERGITLQCAEKLKKVLEETYTSIRVILTRFPGETIDPLQNANFANRLDVDLYLSIHFYEEPDEKPSMFMYYFAYHPTTDFWARPAQLSFYRYDQAHLLNLNTSKSWANVMYKVLSSKDNKRLFTIQGIHHVPFRPLIGIKAPAIALEVSLKSKSDWDIYVKPIVESIAPLIAQKI